MRAIVLSGILLLLLIAAGCTSSPFTITDTSKTIVPTIPVTTPAVLFSDNLSQWNSEWEQPYGDRDGGVLYRENALHIVDANPSSGSIFYVLNRSFGDFALDLDMTTIGGITEPSPGGGFLPSDRYAGVAFRVRGEDYYRAAITSEGYEIGLCNETTRTAFSGSTRSPAVHTGIGAKNHLHIEAKGNSLSMTINGEPIATETDSTIQSGRIALFVKTEVSDSPSEIAFRNLRITSI